ncbi:MAG: cell wall hydrolase, partial [Candidatus Thioglobus sp.]|nr:cell wall hydrolase [Candidatus Thioglobus sp.]
MRQLLIVLLSYLCMVSAYADNKTTLYDFRFWTSPERTRIVIDVEKGVRFSIKKDKKKVTLSVKNAKLLNSTYDKLFFKDKRIKKTNIRRDKNTLLFLFKTLGDYTVKSYTLKPNKKYKHHRLVVDLYDKKSKVVKKKTSKKPIKQKIKKPLSAKSNKKIILIDPGHGGEDPGAIGYKHSREKYITL